MLIVFGGLFIRKKEKKKFNTHQPLERRLYWILTIAIQISALNFTKPMYWCSVNTGARARAQKDVQPEEEKRQLTDQ